MKDSGMALKHLLPYIVALASTAFVHAQSRRQLQGQVITLESDRSSITIQNRKTQEGAVTDADGRFYIEAKPGDTLVLSSLQLKRKEVAITRLSYEARSLEVFMEARVRELEEVILWPYDLTGTLGRDAVRLGRDGPVTAESLGLPNAGVRILSPAERRLFEADHGPLLYFPGVNVNKLLNLISGRTKRLRKGL